VAVVAVVVVVLEDFIILVDAAVVCIAVVVVAVAGLEEQTLAAAPGARLALIQEVLAVQEPFHRQVLVVLAALVLGLSHIAAEMVVIGVQVVLVTVFQVGVEQVVLAHQETPILLGT
jgi:hypothetical protein